MVIDATTEEANFIEIITRRDPSDYRNLDSRISLKELLREYNRLSIKEDLIKNAQEQLEYCVNRLNLIEGKKK